MFTLAVFSETPSDVEASQYDKFVSYNTDSFESEVVKILCLDNNKGE